MDCRKCIQMENKIVDLTHTHSIYEKLYIWKMPKCPDCKSNMVKLYYHGFKMKRINIGYVCRNCKTYIMYNEFKEIKNELFIIEKRL